MICTSKKSISLVLTGGGGARDREVADPGLPEKMAVKQRQ